MLYVISEGTAYITGHQTPDTAVFDVRIWIY